MRLLALTRRRDNVNSGNRRTDVALMDEVYLPPPFFFKLKRGEKIPTSLCTGPSVTKYTGMYRNGAPV